MDGNKPFVSGAGNTNIDLIFSGLPRIPEEGRELLRYAGLIVPDRS